MDERIPQLWRFRLRARRAAEQAHACDRRGLRLPVNGGKGFGIRLMQGRIALAQGVGLVRRLPRDCLILRLRPDTFKTGQKLSDRAALSPVRHDEHVAVDVLAFLIRAEKEIVRISSAENVPAAVDDQIFIVQAVAELPRAQEVDGVVEPTSTFSSAARARRTLLFCRCRKPFSPSTMTRTCTPRRRARPSGPARSRLRAGRRSRR